MQAMTKQAQAVPAPEPLTDSMDQRMSVKEVAAVWSVDQRTVLQLLRTGRLRGFKIGRVWRISSAAVRDYEDANRQKEVAPPPISKRRIVTRIY